ncbi:DNA mismatch repair protein MutS [Marininema mesophilum]|uniref:DNA mismatch repair protein MutS n=1 Tax=Marininema mesophilum TaxID=1048340 RepID=A0A1H2ZGH7_9BACL|nr:DNA mismatch repair protein MutS [Marininema mesophilum]SDX15849.1 DNA mismatch repair protein MutS [Marininema mesophilum]
MSNYTPMIQQYLSIKAEYQDAFLFFRLGDFYELFFEDAKRASEYLELTLTGRDGGGKERIPMCGVPHHAADVYIGRLIEKGYKVALCEQVEDPTQAKGVVKREVVRVVTPGTVMEEKMLAEKENNFLVAVTKREDHYAIAAADFSTGEFYVTELSGSSEQAIDELLAFSPKEVLLSPDLSGDEHFLNQLRGHHGVHITLLKREWLPALKQIEEELQRQFPGCEDTYGSPVSLEVAGILHTYLQQTQKRSMAHMNRLERYDAGQYMVLDTAARQNLELTATLRDGRKKGSLLWLLDQTATAMGSRLLKKWLDKPLLDQKQIENRQGAVQAYVENLILLEEIRDHLRGVYDLERLCARIAYGSANGRDLHALRRSLEAVPALRKRLAGTSSPTFAQLVEGMDPCLDVVKNIARSIVEEPPISIKEGGIICERYDESLDELRTVQREGRSWISQLEQREREATGIRSLKVGFNKVFGYYIEVTRANLKSIPEGRYQRKQTLANAERFVTPELKERERLILTAEEKSVEKEYKLFNEVRDSIASEISRIQKLADQVAQVDALHSLAVVSNRYRYVCPEISTDDTLKIEGGRHPVVEAAVGEGFIANDLHLDRRNRQVLLITGPNMAGKSTYMRQSALITIMAQIGSFVPVKKAVIGIVDRIFTRIGAADDLVGGRSTFMVEMDETRQALGQATSRSLILLDEVGRGTSTYDGMALAQAIVEYIHDHVGAKTLFSTHYHELTALENELSRVVNVNARCIEKDGEVVFLHKIEEGGADRSYGIHVAQLAGLPQEVIYRAQVILKGLESRPEGVEAERELSMHQLDLFQYETAVTKEDPYSEEERKALESLRNWDLLNRAPMESLHLLEKLQRSLQGQSSGGGTDG